jgi:glycosyltransferase involved in cell wall biosynthesis
MNSEPASLAIIGGYPPPYGGVTTHTRRLCALLDERGIDYVVYNAVSSSAPGQRVVSVARRRGRWLASYLLGGREPAVYLMSRRLMAWLVGALLVLLRGKRVMLRLQNAQLIDWERASRWRRHLAAFALRHMTGVVCVRPALADLVARCGVPAERIHWFPGFLPPSLAEQAREAVDPQVWDFVSRTRPVIAANGKVGWHAGEDLYGLDQLVELAARLKPDYPQLGIVICFWDHRPGDQDYLAKLEARAAAQGVRENILFNTRPGLFVPVLGAADLFVRPTNTDGDASSIREALYLEVPTVASDAAERPAGVRCFRSRDVSDFEAQVRRVLEALPPQKQENASQRDPGDLARVDDYVALLAALAEGTPAGGEAVP